MPRRPDNLPARHRGGPVAAAGARPGLPADVAGAMQEKLRLLMAGTAHLRDEYATADLNLDLARNRLEDAGRPALALPPGRAGGPVAARLAGPGPAAGPERAAGLPAVLGAARVAAIAGDVPRARGWTRVRDMPGAYLQNEGIRALMRRQQRQWPCFARHEAIWEAQGRDPLGMVVGLNLVQGMPGADADEIQRVAGWIRENGVVIDAQRVDFGQAFGNYTAEAVLATTEDKTFLLVREPAENGFSGMHIYAWDGGTAVYRDGPGRAFLAERAEARPVARPAERIAAPAGLLPGPAEPRPVAVQERGDGDRRALVRALPAAASPSVAAATDRLAPLRAAGFQPWGSKEGPCLRRPEEDGTTTVLLGEQGRPLARSETFRVRSLDQAGTVLDERAIDDPEDLLRGPASGPRP
ncbi:hypothetical protein PQI07_25465 [Methylobacterium sp. 092160098-2]|jgi:hypothetical protein|uniref:hypothetical protein n=1 Tax=Methylobacterium sp. 092160098-2 TaxID=3025129 RepID=UPI002381C753|nr:hypothetical protein [Methylobacterium sp. 092160098-2]MDE4914023.1 hypothetical protein [Methylobacterium sp. 092160098-2]